MELLYIWIEKYKNLENFGFNFGGEYLFEFDSTSNKGLTYKKNDKYISDFFTSDISNITGLVGKNGSGKSTILEYIFSNFPNGHHQNTEYQCIVVYYNNESRKYKVYSSVKYRNQVLKCDLLAENNLNSIFPKFFHLIHFSNSFYDRITNETTDSISIGLRSLLYKDSESVIFNSINTSVGFGIIKHELFEVKRKILFIKAHNNDESIFRNMLPDFIWVSIDSTSEQLLKKGDGTTFSTESIEQLNSVIKLFSVTTNSKLELFKVEVLKAFALNSIGDFSDIELHHLRGAIKDVTDYDTLMESLKTLYQTKSNSTDRVGKLDTYSDAAVNFIIKFETITERLYRKDESAFSVLTNRLRFKFNEDLLSLIESYDDVLNTKSQFLQFKFGNYNGSYQQSSGEEAFLSLYSRLYDGKKEVQKSDSKHQNILLLLDEPDLYLHPQWQKELINNICKYVPQIYDRYNIQILLTSHSPIIISDLPKNNVVYLNEGKNVTQTIKGGTFGKNIHDLYKDAFFMEGGLMGKFAEEKINQLISDVKNLKDDTNKIKQLIGELESLKSEMNKNNHSEFNQLINDLRILQNDKKEENNNLNKIGSKVEIIINNITNLKENIEKAEIEKLIYDVTCLKDDNSEKERANEEKNQSIKKRITMIDERIYKFKLEDMYNEAMFSGKENINALYEAKLAQLKKRFGK
jgi:predicted ATP-dependent endonuclease of OLD family